MTEQEFKLQRLEKENENLQLEYTILQTGKKTNKLRYFLGVFLYAVTGILLTSAVTIAYNPPQDIALADLLMSLLIIVSVFLIITGSIVLYHSQND